MVKRIYTKEQTSIPKNYRKENRKRLYLKWHLENCFYPDRQKKENFFLFFVIDTSSSMSNKSLMEAKSLLLSLVKERPGWRVVEVHHDLFFQCAFLYERGRVYEVDIEGGKIKKINPVSFKNASVYIKGRGGTSHLEVFQKLYPFRNRGEFIFVTDGISNLEFSLKQYPVFKKALYFAPEVASVYYLKKAGLPFVYYLDSHTVKYAV
jgi:predicted metal-dependent peptidase